MTGNKTYQAFLHYRSSFAACGKMAVCLLFIIFFCTITVTAKTETSNNSTYADNFVTVSLNVQGVGSAEIPAIVKNNVLLLSVTDVFDLLKIKNDVSGNMEAISGFILNEKSAYQIDVLHNRIIYQDKTINLKPDDIIQTESNIYLRSNFFGEIFGLECTFNFRNLSVNLTSTFELPAVREARMESIRHNVSQLRGDQKADTTIKRTYPVFHFGAADWNIISTQQTHGPTQTMVNLGLGATIAGGEAAVQLNYNSAAPIDEKQQYYYWRYANNDNPVVRQVTLGKLYTPLTASVYAPLVGAEVTNTPTTFRRSFGTYTLSNTTQPNWMVELYVNNVLVDYKKADASGFYTFQVPLVYGNTVVKLRFYGPYGEERSQEENISIPFNFLPAKDLEYDASAGYVEDGRNTRFSRTIVNYGIDRHITVGGGMEYLSSVTSGTAMPFANASMMITPQLLASGEYINGVRSKGLITYTLPSNLQLELDEIKYAPGQTAINLNYEEERKASLNIPIRGQHFAMYSRITVDNITLPETKYTNAQWQLSGSLFGVNTNISTFASFYDNVTPYVYSTVAFSVRLPKGYTMTPQVQYAYQKDALISLKGTLEKYFMKRGYLNVYYEQDVQVHANSFGIGVRYDFDKVQLGSTVTHSGDNTAFSESARGSLVYDGGTGYKNANTQINVGKGGIKIIPFLDLNCNGHRDEGEPLAYGLKFHINGGRIDDNPKDTVIHILNLEPYTSYFIELDRNSFDNVAWQIKKQTIRACVAPNQFTTVEVPVSVMAEASGTVYFKTGNAEKEQGRIRINLYDSKGYLINRALSDPGGYFNFEELAPGAYTLCPDSAQLRTLKFSATPAVIKMNIAPNRDGDVVDKMKFLLQPQGDTVSLQGANDTTLRASFGVVIKVADTATAPDLQIGNYEHNRVNPNQSPILSHLVRHEDFYVPLSSYIVPFPGNLGLYLFRKQIAAFMIKKIW